MCTLLLVEETTTARKMSARETQECVDRLMEYDRRLSAPFTREELEKLRQEVLETRRQKELEKLGEDSHAMRFSEIFTEEEKQLLAELGTSLPVPDGKHFRYPVEREDARRDLKARFVERPVFPSRGDFSSCPSYEEGDAGRICVWLDNCRYGNTQRKGFYYVRYQFSMQDHGTTAYECPALVVDRKKLRRDQRQYMAEKYLYTVAAAPRGVDTPSAEKAKKDAAAVVREEQEIVREGWFGRKIKFLRTMFLK